MTILTLAEDRLSAGGDAQPAETPHLENLDAFRPLGDRAPEPQVAEVQRREFFAQLHRWLRQNYTVQVFCNNLGERQRFTEIWQEYGFDSPQSGQYLRVYIFSLFVVL